MQKSTSIEVFSSRIFFKFICLFNSSNSTSLLYFTESDVCVMNIRCIIFTIPILIMMFFFFTLTVLLFCPFLPLCLSNSMCGGFSVRTPNRHSGVPLFTRNRTAKIYNKFPGNSKRKSTKFRGLPVGNDPLCVSETSDHLTDLERHYKQLSLLN